MSKQSENIIHSIKLLEALVVNLLLMKQRQRFLFPDFLPITFILS